MGLKELEGCKHIRLGFDGIDCPVARKVINESNPITMAMLAGSEHIVDIRVNQLQQVRRAVFGGREGVGMHLATYAVTHQSGVKSCAMKLNLQNGAN